MSMSAFKGRALACKREEVSIALVVTVAVDSAPLRAHPLQRAAATARHPRRSSKQQKHELKL